MKGLEQICEALKAASLTEETFDFDCFSDGIFSYYFERNGELFELSIHSDDTFFKKEEGIDLINKERITYAALSLFDNETDLCERKYRLEHAPFRNIN